MYEGLTSRIVSSTLLWETSSGLDICLGHVKDCLPSDSADGLTYYSDEVYSWVFIERNQLAGYKGYKSRWIDHCSADMPGQGG